LESRIIKIVNIKTKRPIRQLIEGFPILHVLQLKRMDKLRCNIYVNQKLHSITINKVQMVLRNEKKCMQVIKDTFL